MAEISWAILLDDFFEPVQFVLFNSTVHCGTSLKVRLLVHVIFQKAVGYGLANSGWPN
jgi:hypothetical protein